MLNRDFVLLWHGQFISQIGRQAFQIAMMFWIKDVTNSASLMGLITMLSALPGLIVGPFGGTVADRHSRKAIILGADLVRGLTVLILAALLVWRPEAHELLVPAFFGVAIFGGITYAFFMPAISASIPSLVPRDKVPAANSLKQISVQSSIALGQAMGGILYGLLGAPVLLLIDSLTYMYSALCTLWVRIPQSFPEITRKAEPAFSGYMADTWEGLRYIWRRAGMRDFLLVVAALNFFFMPVFVLLPFYVEGLLGGRPSAYGFIMASFALGGLAGYGLAGALRVTGKKRAALIISALVGTSVLFGSVGLVDRLEITLACFLGIGLLTGLINVFSITLFQISSPGEMRGRVMGLVLALSRAASPIGMGLGGILGDLMSKNIPLIYLVCGSLPLILSLWASSRAPFREFLAWDDATAEPVS